MKARDLIRRSLKLLGVLAAGENPSAEEQADALDVLNDMIESWSIENLIIPSETTEDFPSVAGQSLYTMGPTGNFNTVRPLQIDGVAFVDTQNEFPLFMMSLDEWQQIQNKSIQSTIPSRVFVNAANPLYELNIFPVPSAVKTIRVYSLKQLASLTTVDTVISFPPGYKQALIHNLAIVLSPEYGKQVDPIVTMVANESKAKIKRKNIKARTMTIDSALLQTRRFNIYRGN